MAQKLSARTLKTAVESGDMIYVYRPSLGAAGSFRISIDDFEESAGEVIGKYIYAIHGQMMEPQAPNAVILAPVVPAVDITIPASPSLHTGKALVAATNITTFSLRKNGVQFGTMGFLAGASVPGFTILSDTDFTGGSDYLTVVGPSSPDPTLALFGFTIYGVR